MNEIIIVDERTADDCILLKLHSFACYRKEPKRVTAFGSFTFFCADLSNQKPAGNCHRLLIG